MGKSTSASRLHALGIMEFELVWANTWTDAQADLGAWLTALPDDVLGRLSHEFVFCNLTTQHLRWRFLIKNQCFSSVHHP